MTDIATQPLDRNTDPASAAPPMSMIGRFFDSDIWYSFRTTKIAIIAAIVTGIFVVSATFAPWVAPKDPYDLAALSIMDNFKPPSWAEGGSPEFLLGTDDQGRDLLSAIIYGSRMSLFVGFASTLFAMTFGVTIGMIAGFRGGAVDAILMRIADVQLSFSAVLIALLIDGVARSIVPSGMHNEIAVWVLIFSIGISGWVNFARTVRGSCMVERGKEYVQAARVIGIRAPVIMLRHLLPNVMGPVLVIGTIQLAVVCLVVMLLDRTVEGGLGGAELPAPQAVLMKLVIDGVLDQNLPWGLILIGVGIALVAAMFRVPVLAFAVGVYLPLYTMAAVFLGGLLRWWLSRHADPATVERRRERGVLFGSGLVGGGGLTGVLLALWVGVRGGKKIVGYPIDLSGLSDTAATIVTEGMALVGLLAILGLAAALVVRGERGAR